MQVPLTDIKGSRKEKLVKAVGANSREEAPRWGTKPL